MSVISLIKNPSPSHCYEQIMLARDEIDRFNGTVDSMHKHFAKIFADLNQLLVSLSITNRKLKNKLRRGTRKKGVNYMIKKEGSKYVVKSKSTGKNLGTYKTKGEATKRLRQIEFFKHKKAAEKK